MSFNFNKQLNADEQEPIASNEAESTATPNEPVQEAIATDSSEAEAEVVAEVESTTETPVEAAVETAVEAAVEAADEAEVETPVEAAVETAVEAEIETAAEVAAPVETVVAPSKPVYVPVVETAHDDFDWSRDKRNVSAYSAEEKAKYDDVYDNTFKQINDGEEHRTEACRLR